MKNNKLKQELLKIYTERKEDFKKIRGILDDTDLAGPLLISPTEIYSKQTNSLLVIGKQTIGWEYDYDDLEKQMKNYEDFNVGENIKEPSKFWSVTRKLEEELGNEEYSCAWTNISKFDVAGGGGHGVEEIEISKFDNLLEKEIEILKPKICIFFTGPTFNSRIMNIFKGVEFSEVEGFTTSQLSQLKHKCLPESTFRTYSPPYIITSGMEHKFLEFFSKKYNPASRHQ